MPSRRHRRPPFRALVALGVVGVLALAGCSDDGAEEREEREKREAAAPATWPLTGLEVGGRSAEQRRPVLVLKMDNTASSAPQRGLSSADLVVEELVEGGVTRLAVFYYSDIPDLAGPVRSMRASDIGIVAPVDATMVTSGAAPPTIARLAEADVPFVTEGSPGFFREPGRAAPYDLMADLGEVAKSLTERDSEPVRPPDYLPFGDAGDLPAGRRAESFAVQFSPARTTTWTFRNGTYVDTATLAATDDQFPADSVLVLRVRIGDAGYRDPAGNTVPETELVGSGAASLFHDGRLVRGTWSKTALDAPLTLTRRTPDGEVPLPVPPGRTWIELMPQSGAVTVG